MALSRPDPPKSCPSPTLLFPPQPYIFPVPSGPTLPNPSSSLQYLHAQTYIPQRSHPWLTGPLGLGAGPPSPSLGTEGTWCQDARPGILYGKYKEFWPPAPDGILRPPGSPMEDLLLLPEALRAIAGTASLYCG